VSLEQQCELKMLQNYMESLDASLTKMTVDWGCPRFEDITDTEILGIERLRCASLMSLFELKITLVGRQIRLQALLGKETKVDP
jgi:hypothetical protein